MSSFKAEVFKIKEIEPHPYADRLEIVKYLGWTIVVGKGNFKVGELAAYIPLYARLPESLVDSLGIKSYYHSKIRAVKLRGIHSQGLLIKAQEGWTEGEDVTNLLGITKWEEPIRYNAGESLPPEPSFQIYTDIENIKNFPTIFNKDEQLVLLEKIHGTNGRAMKLDGKILVGSHRINLKESESSLYWKAARMLDVEKNLEEGDTVFFEVFGSGVQDLTYGLSDGKIGVAVLDVIRDGKYLDYYDLVTLCDSNEWMMPPVAGYMGWGKTKESLEIILQLLNRKDGKGMKSIICPTQIAEGLVIRPTIERFSHELKGRCILKAHSDAYLTRKDATEKH